MAKPDEVWKAYVLKPLEGVYEVAEFYLSPIRSLTETEAKNPNNWKPAENLLYGYSLPRVMEWQLPFDEMRAGEWWWGHFGGGYVAARLVEQMTGDALTAIKPPKGGGVEIIEFPDGSRAYFLHFE